jgi:DNA polymerase III subunit epsilon
MTHSPAAPDPRAVPDSWPRDAAAPDACAQAGVASSFGAYGRQASFDELGTPLREVTFVVVDLETTGGSPLDCEITEVGAVKVRGG